MENIREKFKSRQWTTGELKLLNAHLSRPRDTTEPRWRDRFIELLSLHRPECPHTVCALVEVETDYGIWGHEICLECGISVQRECPHVRCTWHNDGQALICDNCGVDGT